MTKSMTGYGRGKATLHGREITVELRAVNHRYLDLNIKSPRAYGFLEDAIKTRMQGAISRGKVDVFVTIDASRSDDVTVTVNHAAVRAYLAALEELAGTYALSNDVTVTELTRYPDVLTSEREEADAEELAGDVLAVLDHALAEFGAMREREGAHLREDILSRCQTIAGYVSFVEERSPETVSEYREKLTQRIRDLIEGVEVDPQRILTEAAIFADKTAVAEETVRLRSHLSGLEKMLAEKKPVGRKLDFLVQELNREANTIGSKANDYEIARTVVELKAEIEKIREQVQNIE